MSTQAAKTLDWNECQNLVKTDDALSAAMEKVDQVDLTMLKRKQVEEYGWTPEYTNQVEDLYRKFLVLNLIYPRQKICPTGPVDDFWHAHILDTRAYAADCDSVFGYFLHHYPFFGMRGSDDRKDLEDTFAQSRELFIRHFGIDPCVGDVEARSCSVQNCP